MLDIKITRTTSPKEKPQDETKLGFGKKFTDHMFVMDYTEGEGWHDARIVPYAPFPLDPATVVFHYAQEIFEGMKAYRTADDTIQLFRPDCNAKRFQDSADRLCIPKIPEEDFVQAVEALVDVERDWVPHTDGASLYIRPFIFANDVGLGVHASKHYIFCIICAPSGAYYAEGINPVRIYVEDEYIRAAPGLTGFTKCGGNYAASIKAGELAEEQGYAQVLWLDGVEKKYVEEVGSMNIMFKIDGKVYTAATVGTVLPGVTRRSCIELLKDWGYDVIEGKLAIADIMQAAPCSLSPVRMAVSSTLRTSTWPVRWLRGSNPGRSWSSPSTPSIRRPGPTPTATPTGGSAAMSSGSATSWRKSCPRSSISPRSATAGTASPA